MRPADGALTARGIGLCAVGAALCGAAAVTGVDGLLRAGVVALALPLLALALARLARPRLEVARSLVPARLPAGGTARVTLALRTSGWLAPRRLRAEDARSPGLGRPSRFVAERGAGGATTTVTYALRPAGRGRYAVGPLVATAVDPLGLVAAPPARTAGPAADVRSLLVLPAVEALPALPAGSAWAGSGERASLSVTTTGEHSAGAREYRSGDVVRRVHWRATARAGQLMVRQEEDPLQQQAVVLLDTGAAAWASPAAFERAVSAAASVVSLLGGGGAPVELVLRSSALVGTTDELLDALAVVAVEDAGSGPALPFPALTGLGRSGTPASVVAVLGQLGGDGADRHGPGGVLPLLLPLPQRGVRASALVLPPAGAGAGSLRAAGWVVAEALEGEPLAAAWSELAAAPARRAG